MGTHFHDSTRKMETPVPFGMVFCYLLFNQYGIGVLFEISSRWLTQLEDENRIQVVVTPSSRSIFLSCKNHFKKFNDIPVTVILNLIRRKNVGNGRKSVLFWRFRDRCRDTPFYIPTDPFLLRMWLRPASHESEHWDLLNTDWCAIITGDILSTICQFMHCRKMSSSHLSNDRIRTKLTFSFTPSPLLRKLTITPNQPSQWKLW
jgi:hypothetical protein